MVALSLPIRRDSPPARSTALMFMLFSKWSFRAERGTSHRLPASRSLFGVSKTLWARSFGPLRMTVRGRAEHAIAKNFRAQAAATFQEFLRAERDGAIHPVAWAAFLHAVETNAVNFEVLANQLVQIGAPGDHVAPRQSRRTV